MEEPQAPALLREFLLPAIQEAKANYRLHVTLTYAQSLDGKIAGVGGKQLRLSGKESMLMTHWMRTMHDGILVGIGTVLNDDPQLNARYLPPRPDGQQHPLPRPIILDTHMRIPPTSKLLLNHYSGVGRQPMICSTKDMPQGSEADSQNFYARINRLNSPETLVHRILSDSQGRVDIHELLVYLQKQGIHSLMVEGGQRIISAFLAARPKIVDLLIVTVAPTLVGRDGTGVLNDDLHDSATPELTHLVSENFGRDTVIACKLA